MTDTKGFHLNMHRDKFLDEIRNFNTLETPKRAWKRIGEGHEKKTLTFPQRDRMDHTTTARVPLTVVIVGAVCSAFVLSVIMYITWRRCYRQRRKSSTYEQIVSEHKSSNILVENATVVPAASVRYACNL
ncbi:uncharacterized protein LOC110451524 [Mizuhopecten yessoensis]|uniref:uncharacterized protein LOC110451524 n=1 Tax=Mizuhopecten yessoensis TaxID=6573 RepID=UPI000B45F722|nr:uncharacterized protein LOC110451524 [Mizuhopecten yessoensis]